MSLLKDSLVKTTLNQINPYSIFSKLIRSDGENIFFKDEKLLKPKGKIFIFGVGKSASFEVDALYRELSQSCLKQKLEDPFSYTKWGHTVKANFEQLEGDHPYISEHNLKMTEKFLKKIETITKDDLLIFCLSGGASSLLEKTPSSLSFKELKEKHRQLLHSEKSINEINEIRKSLSLVKNGGLLNWIHTDNILHLVNCDIPNEKIESVGSSPLLSFLSPTKIKSIKWNSPSLFLERFSQNSPLPCTLKKVYDCSFKKFLDDIEKNLPKEGQLSISAGETPFQLPSHAKKGGRNTHTVLALAEKIYKNDNNKDIHIQCMGTDGTDGPTDAAGAYINYKIYKNCENSKHFLHDFNSYEYFQKLGTLIKTGPTMSNVTDFRCLWRDSTGNKV